MRYTLHYFISMVWVFTLVPRVQSLPQGKKTSVQPAVRVVKNACIGPNQSDYNIL